jgi:hypothetical protein
MERKISDLSINEFKQLFKEIIHDELKNFDPDSDLVLRDDVKDESSKNIAEKKLRNINSLSD